MKMATGEESDDESLGGAEMHARISGSADYFAVDELDAIRIGRRIVARLNWRKQDRRRARSPSRCSTPRNSRHRAVGSACPVRPAGRDRPNRRRLGLRRVQGALRLVLVTGWANLYGYPIGILANRAACCSARSRRRPPSSSSWPTADTPLLFLHNTTGYMVGKQYEEGGMIKHGSMMINAVSNSTVPHISLLIGRLLRRRPLRHVRTRLRPAVPVRLAEAQVRVMGGTQLAGVLSIVSRAAAEARGQQVDEDADAALRAAIEAQIEAESLPMFLSGRLYDDGVIDPRDTRTVLGMCLVRHCQWPDQGDVELRRLPDVSP